jgi:hypothetical protein
MERRPSSPFPLLAAALAISALTAQKPAASPPPAKPPAKDALATTKEAQDALAIAKSKLGATWDYLVQPDCIVLFDFEPKHPDTKVKGEANAKLAAAQFTATLAYFRADLPPHAAFGKQVPILRVFRDDQDERAFLGADTLLRLLERQIALALEGEVCARHAEIAWIFYQRQWLGEDGQPERWFRTLCLARYRRLRGDGKAVVYDPPDLSKKSPQIDSVSLDDALTAMQEDDHIESFWMAFADFVERGPKVLGKDFDPAWSKIVPDYAEGVRTISREKARERVFANLDMGKLEQAVKAWAKKR